MRHLTLLFAVALLATGCSARRGCCPQEAPQDPGTPDTVIWRTPTLVPDVIEGAKQPNHTGRVLAADDDAGVVVISLGAQDGVEVGFQYVVARGNTYVGMIRIHEVKQKQAAGKTLRELQKLAPQTGDTVTSHN